MHIPSQARFVVLFSVSRGEEWRDDGSEEEDGKVEEGEEEDFVDVKGKGEKVETGSERCHERLEER